MGEDRLSNLALINIHHEFEVNTDKVIEEFKKEQSSPFLKKLAARLITTK